MRLLVSIVLQKLRNKMNDQTPHQIIAGTTGKPITTGFEDAMALPVSDRIVVLEDCAELPLAKLTR
jgi:Flp pilus assembly CpaF family ATPase